MHIVSTGYSYNPVYSDAEEWLEKISFYSGILEMIALRHKVTSIEQIDLDAVLTRRKVNYHFFKRKGNGMHGWMRVNEHIRSLKPDVIFVNGLIFPLQVIHLRMRVGPKVKIILLHRGEEPGNKMRRSLQRFADRFIDGYAFISHEIGHKWVSEGIISSPRKILEVVDASSIYEIARTDMHVGVDGPVFLFVGRLNENKDPETVMNGFFDYAKNYRSARMFFIYQTTELLDKLKKMVAQKDMHEQVDFIGSQSKEQLQGWYNRADFIISGSRHEGSGISVIEAMSCGCVPILTRIPSFIKITGEATAGFLYEPGNAVSLSKVLASIAIEDVPEMRARVLNRFEEEFSFAAISRKLCDYIKPMSEVKIS